MTRGGCPREIILLLRFLTRSRVSACNWERVKGSSEGTLPVGGHHARAELTQANHCQSEIQSAHSNVSHCITLSLNSMLKPPIRESPHEYNHRVRAVTRDTLSVPQQDRKIKPDRNDVLMFVGGGGIEGLKLKDGFRSFDHLKRDPTAPLPAQFSDPPSCFRPGSTRITMQSAQNSTPGTVFVRRRKRYFGSARPSEDLPLLCKARGQHCDFAK